MRPCPSFPGYLATEDGRVISCRRRRAPLVLRQQVAPKGYRYVSLGKAAASRTPLAFRDLLLSIARSARAREAA